MTIRFHAWHQKQKEGHYKAAVTLLPFSIGIGIGVQLTQLTIGIDRTDRTAAIGALVQRSTQLTESIQIPRTDSIWSILSIPPIWSILGGMQIPRTDPNSQTRSKFLESIQSDRFFQFRQSDRFNRFFQSRETELYTAPIRIGISRAELYRLQFQKADTLHNIYSTYTRLIMLVCIVSERTVSLIIIQCRLHRPCNSCR